MSKLSLDEQIELRRVNRETAGRYSAGLLTPREVMGWLKEHFPNDVRSGRLSGELLVSLEALDDVPGDDVQRFTNAAGESVYRKKLTVKGAPTVDIAITAIKAAGE